MSKTKIIKVTLNAVKFPRRPRRIMYASFYRGLPVKAPSTGITIQGYHYDPYEVIPAQVIQIADSEERDKLFEMIDQEKKSLNPGPAQGQSPLPGMEDVDVPDQDTIDRKRREKARAFIPLDMITTRGDDAAHNKYYEDMYDWMMNHYEDWYKNLSDDQELQAKSFGRRIKIAGEMNPYLRGRRSGGYEHTSDAIEEGIRVFDSLVDDAPPIEQDTITYRGIPDLKSLVSGGATTIKKGDVIDNGQYMSTAIDPSISINSFMSSGDPESLLMRIVLPNGTRVAPVTAWNIYNDRHDKSRFVSGSGSHEMELTLPRDSKLRVVSEPHYETLKHRGGTKQVRIADFELVPQPTPEESPKLPHKDIQSFATGGRQDFYNEEDIDPWEDHDPDDMKYDKEKELETLIEEYEENQGHDAPTLAELRKFDQKLQDVDHTNYDDPSDFDDAMDLVIGHAKHIIANAPDHTEEIWAAFNPGQEKYEYLADADRELSRFARDHDTSNPIVADYLKQLKLIRDGIADADIEDLRDNYDFPDDFTDSLSKQLTAMQRNAEIGHHLYAENVAGKPPLFMGADLTPDQLSSWIRSKKEFDVRVAKLRDRDKYLADQVQILWDKATHKIEPGWDSQALMNKIEMATKSYSLGLAPDKTSYGHGTFNNIEQEVNHQVMLHKSIHENTLRAKEMGVFQGQDVNKEDIKKWARKNYDFNKNLSDYRSTQEKPGGTLHAAAGQMQALWDKASKELPPNWDTFGILDRLIDASSVLKNSGNINDYSMEDIKSRLLTSLVSNGSPKAKLEARITQLNNRYDEAIKRLKNTYGYPADHKFDFLAKFKDYVKSKGIDGTEFEHMVKLPEEIQEQIFKHANLILNNIGTATAGNISARDVWQTPEEEKIQPPGPGGLSTLDKLKFKSAKEKIINELMENTFAYGNTSHYDAALHAKFNKKFSSVLDYPDGPEKLEHLRTMLDHSRDLLDDDPLAEAAIDRPLKTAPVQSKSLNVQFINKLQELKDLTDKQATFKEKQDIEDEFYDYAYPPAFKNEFNYATPEEKQKTLDHINKVLTKYQTEEKEPEKEEPGNILNVNWEDAYAKAQPSTPEDWTDLFHQKVQEFKEAKEEHKASPYYDPENQAKMEKNFWFSNVPQNVKYNYTVGSTEHKQAMIANFDEIINKTKSLSKLSAIYHPEDTEHGDDTESISDEIANKLIKYEDTPMSDPTTADEIKFHHDETMKRLKTHPQDKEELMAELHNINGELDQAIDEHTGKLGKISKDIYDTHPQINNKQGFSELSQKFPHHVNQIHLDMANYKETPNYDSMSHAMVLDMLDDAAEDWEKNKDPEEAHDTLKSILRYTKKKVTNEGKEPHQTLFKGKPGSTRSPKTSPSKALKAPPSHDPDAQDEAPHVTYERFVKHIQYARRRRIKVTLMPKQGDTNFP